jgi:hypothetical protein
MGMEADQVDAILEAAVEHIEGHDNPDETTPGHFAPPPELQGEEEGEEPEPGNTPPANKPAAKPEPEEE